MKDILKKVADYLKETQGEIKKVSWPQRQYVIVATIMVVVIVIVMGLLVTFLDIGISKVVMFITKAI